MTPFFLHIGFMAAGFLCIAAGIVIVKTPALKRRYFKLHKAAGIAGTLCGLAGAAAAVVMVYLNDGGHLKVPHAYLGILAVLGMVCTVSLGLAQFKWKAKALKIRTFHQWAGRATVLLLLAAILTGLIHAGII
jgi:hypothetical protein